MRNIILIGASLLPMTAVAIEYPAIKDPVFTSMVEHYKSDRPTIEAPNFFAAPATAVSSDCKIPEIDLYRLAGLDSAHPELLKKKAERNARKLSRSLGEGKGNEPIMKWENIQFTITELPCQDGVVDGIVKMYVTFDEILENTTSTTSGSTTFTTQMKSTTHASRWAIHAVAKGVIQDDAALYTRQLTQMETHFSDPVVEKTMQSMAKTQGTNAPTEMIYVSYTTGHGASLRSSTFNIASAPNLATMGSGKQKVDTKLQSIFVSGVDDQRTTMEMYSDNDLSLRNHSKNDALHGESIVYMENFYKKMNMSWKTMPGMEDAREVAVNGKDLLEVRTCYQDGALVKISPCPAE